MSGELITLEPGDVVPDCPIPLRPDGSCEQVAHVLDPVQLDLVLGVDVSLEQEQAIMEACREITTDEAAHRRLWRWCAIGCDDHPVVTLFLHLRPGRVQWAKMMWALHYPAHDLCERHAREIGEAAQSVANRLADADGTQGLHARILVVGRDHRLLGISHVACHADMSLTWLVWLISDCCRRLDLEHPEPPTLPVSVFHHIAGLPHTMEPRAAFSWMRDHGWMETPEQLRHRRRRLAAKRRDPE